MKTVPIDTLTDDDFVRLLEELAMMCERPHTMQAHENLQRVLRDMLREARTRIQNLRSDCGYLE